jgi:hypothetical protein
MNPAFEPRPPPRQGAPTRPAPTEEPPGFSAQQSGRQPEPRSEPSFGAGGAGADAPDDARKAQAPPFAGSAYSQIAQQSPWYQQTGPLHRNPVSRVMLMAGIFVVGAAVGLAATWWMSMPADNQPPTAAVRKFEPVTEAPASKAASAAVTGSATGINPSELPYDGKPPGASVDAAPAAIAQPPTAKTDSSPSPRRAEVPRSASRANREPDEPPLVTAPPPAPKKAEQAVAGVPADTGSKAPAAPTAKVQETKVAKAPHRYRTSPKIAKDKEIERIQQQADDELKKKSRSGDGIEAARSRTELAEKKPARQASDDGPPHIAGNGSKRAALARCAIQEDSLIGRELCKWKVCSGMWGKNGCPSYERQVSVHY